MDKSARIYVAGHRGLVGSALVRALQRAGYQNLLLRTHAELDLEQGAAVQDFFAQEKPEYVLLAAAKVGGILANNTYPVDFIQTNLNIQSNVIQAAHRHGVSRLLFLGSSCIYPRDCPQPMREEYLLTGPLEATNRPYALAKIAGIEQCWAYNRQYATRYVAVMPTNMYGPGDNYDLANSHVLPALLRKMHEAHAGGQSEVTIWGSGRPRREFLYSDDLADACLFLLNLPDDHFAEALGLGSDRPPLLNIGCGEDVAIAELAQLIAEVVGYTGIFRYDASKPDGTPRKLLDVSRLSGLGWRAKTGLREGIARSYADFLSQKR